MSKTGLTSGPVMSERRVSLLGALLVVIGPISMALYTPAMPAIADYFETTESAVKLTLTAYFGGFAFAQLVAGFLSDALGRRPVTFGFMLIYIAASVFAIIAPSVEALIIARFVQGIGASVGIAVSRAIVRDLFTGDKSSKIMNLIGIILAIGPALAPTIGGLLMEAAGWRSIFIAMFVFSVFSLVTIALFMKETVEADRSKLKIGSLMHSYGELVVNKHFLTTSGVISGAIGAIYAQATFLPFILMGRVGLTPTQFGLGMLLQTGSFFVGSLLVRHLMNRFSAYRLVTPGLVMIAVGSVLIACLLFVEPTFLTVMGPVIPYAFGIAFVLPAMSTAILAPFPDNAGAASALSGFMQMGSGLAMGSLGALMGDPVIAMATVIPLMGLISIVCYVIYRRNPHLAEPEPNRNVIGGTMPGRSIMPDDEAGR